MKNALILFISLLLSGNIQAQIHWFYSIDAAKSVARKTNKLIVMDFWATWCRPCINMDSQLWGNSEMQKISKNFVGLKINVDVEKNLVATYIVRVIPRVVIITAGEDIIWEKIGFDNAEDFLQVFTALPENVGELNLKSIPLLENKKDLQANYSVGIEYQHLGKNIKNNELKTSFLNWSKKYLTKAQRLCNDSLMDEEIELYLILNDIYSGRSQNTLKMIEKMNPKPQNENLAEFRHLILAKYYESVNDQDNYLKEKQQINKKEYTDQLEN